MHLLHTRAADDAPFDPADARDRWEWVSRARATAASSCERSRAQKNPDFYLKLPHQVDASGR